MDGNKDDALKCLRIGKEAIESGDRGRAVKFLNKARRLDPNLAVDELLSSLEIEAEAATASESSRPEEVPIKPSKQPSLRHRNPSSAAAGSSSSNVTAAYTEEQIKIVREIKGRKDYYDLLGLEKGCSVEDVRKAYRKLSLKVHPDKNKAPGAEEAFKSVSKAFQCLSNEESRRKYDLTGSEEPVYQMQSAAPRNGFNGFYDEEFDADEIFRSFFFGGMPPATAQFRTYHFGRRAPRRTEDHGGFDFRVLIQLLPVLLILLINFIPSSQPVYSLSRSHPYQYKFTTQKGVNYYVRSDTFEEEYPLKSPQRVRVEEQADRDYYSVLAQNCRVELQRQQWGFIRETPHCDMLRRFQTTAAS